MQWQLLWDLLRRLGLQGTIQSLYDGCPLSMRVNGVIGDSQAPSTGLRQGCPLSATLFGIFIDGLHHYLETAVPTAGIQILQIPSPNMKHMHRTAGLVQCIEMF